MWFLNKKGQLINLSQYKYVQIDPSTHGEKEKVALYAYSDESGAFKLTDDLNRAEAEEIIKRLSRSTGATTAITEAPPGKTGRIV